MNMNATLLFSADLLAFIVFTINWYGPALRPRGATQPDRRRASRRDKGSRSLNTPR